jgi:glycerol-3-phosphate acyltransferase PlsY
MNEEPMLLVASAVAGIVCGSIPFGYLAGRVKRIDIRKHGSGNIGFTNVFRTMGAVWAVPVLALDIAKGLIPVALAASLGLEPALVGAGAILGHVFTPWLGFRGGKGVATTIGVCAFLCLRSLGAGLGVYTLVLLTTGFISVASLLFAVSLPALTSILYRGDTLLLVFTAVVGVVIVMRHAANIRRLLQGTEPRFGLWLRLFRRRR